MFKIGYDKKITMVQGDTGVIRMRISNYELSQGDEVRFAIANKANPSILLCQHSDKKIVLEKQVTVFEKDGSARILIYPYDTEYLQPGKYLYEIQVKTKDGRIDTVVPLTSFTLMDGSIQGEYGQTTPSKPEPTPSEIELRFTRLENEIIPALGDRVSAVENEIDSVSSSLDDKANWISLSVFKNNNIDDYAPVINEILEKYDSVLINDKFPIKSKIIMKAEKCLFGYGKLGKLIVDEELQNEDFIIEFGKTVNATRSEIHNLTIVGNGKCNGVYIAPYSNNNTARVKLNNVTIEEFKIGLLDDGMGNSLINSEIRRCIEVNYRNSGSDTFVSDCRFTDSKGGYGVELVQCGNIQFDNSKVLYNENNGMLIERCSLGSFTNLAIQENLKENLIIDSSYLMEFENITSDSANKNGVGVIDGKQVSIVRVQNNSYLNTIKGKFMFGSIYGNEKYIVHIDDTSQNNNIDIKVKGRRSRDYIDYYYCNDILNNNIVVNDTKIDEYYVNYNRKRLSFSDVEITSYYSQTSSIVEKNKFIELTMNCYDNINNSRAFNFILPIEAEKCMANCIFEDGKIFDSAFYKNPMAVNHVITINNGLETKTLTNKIYDFSPNRYNLNKNVKIGVYSSLANFEIPSGYNITKQVLQFIFKVNSLVEDNPFTSDNKNWITNIKCAELIYI